MDSVKLRGEGGVEWEFDLPLSEGIAEQLNKGLLSPADEKSAEALSETTEGPTAPAAKASKKDWYDYRAAQGYSDDELDGLTKAQLQELPDREA